MPHPSTPAGPTRRRLIVAGAAGAAALAARPALAQFRVEISGIGATQIPVAVALFRDEGAAPVRVSDVVRADLLRSGLFRLVDVADALDERSLPNLAGWRT
ncbi:MAG TPA: Tol-Pal system protein TolB, partial [Rubrivivax sp.]|nr:Tol-Pal system protein TolB [Rubrivivax sp.]